MNGSLQNINAAKSVHFKSRMVRVQSCAASLSCLGTSICTVDPTKVRKAAAMLIVI